MGKTDASVKMEQSSRIASIGCFGAVLVLILLVLIGAVAVRSDLTRKRSTAFGDLGRMQEQVEKAPGIMERMIAYECGKDMQETLGDLADRIDSMPTAQNMDELDSIWREVESVWAEISAECSGEGMDELEIEMEGIRNRYSVEKGKFREDADVYNAALRTFFATMFGWGYEPL